MNLIFDDKNYSNYQTLSKNHASPVGPLALITTSGNDTLAQAVSQRIYELRLKRLQDNPEKAFLYGGYLRSNYILDASCVRFSSGEGKAVIKDTVRGHDLVILADVTNREKSFKIFGQDVPYAPDDHFQDIKRLILAAAGKATRITVVMPYLYQAKQDVRHSRESLDCAVALKELISLGVDSIICLEPHEPRVENAISKIGLDNFPTSYLLIESLLSDNNDIIVDPEHLAVISPDEGGMKRAVYYSSILGLQLSTFYRERDYATLVNGAHPITAIRFLGEDVKGKDVLIIDDMISSGYTMIQTARELKEHLGAKNIYCICTFPLMTDGLEPFHQAYAEGLIQKVYGTNLIWHPEELKQAPWYVDANAAPYLAKIIDAVNHNVSTSSFMDQTDRINRLLESRQVK